MNELDFCQNPQNIIFGAFFGTFWALLTRRDFFSKIRLRHVFYFMTSISNFIQKLEKTDEPFLRSCVGNRQKDGRTN